MAEQIQTDIYTPEEPVIFVYQGQLQTRRAFSQYLKHLCSKLKFLEEFKWNQDRSLSQVNIYTDYPTKDIKYPLITVDANFVGDIKIGFRDVSTFAESSSTKGTYVFSGIHIFSVDLNFFDYGKERLQDLMDRITGLLKLSFVREKIKQTYGLEIDHTRDFSYSNIVEKKIEGTNQVEFQGTASCDVHNQWEIHLLEEDYDVINSEKVEVTEYI